MQFQVKIDNLIKMFVANTQNGRQSGKKDGVCYRCQASNGCTLWFFATKELALHDKCSNWPIFPLFGNLVGLAGGLRTRVILPYCWLVRFPPDRFYQNSKRFPGRG